MKILKLIIKDYQQFKHLELDLTHPETGEPLDKICFIGRNATGKSTILWLLKEIIYRLATPRSNGLFCGKLVFLIEISKQNYYLVHWLRNALVFPECIDEKIPDWQSVLFEESLFYDLWKSEHDNSNEKRFHQFDELAIKNISDSIKDYLLIYCPPESERNSYLFEDVPETSLNEALSSRKSKTNNHIVSQGTAKDFWEQLIYLMNYREKQLKQYAIDNKTKSYEQILKEFNAKNPDIFVKIADLWNKILDKADLYFDIESIKTPTVLSDNLQAYIKSKKTDEIIKYQNLSTGIRNFIFIIGHIYSLYFNRKIEWGFLLVDEPENSLFPDFLYDLIDEVYCKILENQNTQFFVSTHNPIIAAQYEAYERIILDFDNNGYVTAKKGIVPVGDDPNDILYKDFGMRSIYTKKGLEKWNRFIELEDLIKKEKRPEIKMQMQNR